jgi:hypothetical protein
MPVSFVVTDLALASLSGFQVPSLGRNLKLKFRVWAALPRQLDSEAWQLAAQSRSPGRHGPSPPIWNLAKLRYRSKTSRYRFMDDIEYQTFDIEGQLFSFDFGYDM